MWGRWSAPASATMSSMTVVYVAIAGAAGVLARYGLSLPFEAGRAQVAILAINVVGSFGLGYLTGASVGQPTRTAVGTGFLGGFTTFSTFSVQAYGDLEAGRPGRALAYVAASVLLGVGAAALGYALARQA